MLNGLMMERPLLISDIIRYAADVHPDGEVVSAAVEGGIHRYTYRDSLARISQLAHALRAQGIGPGDRVATLAWNGYRHFELYYAISGIGAVCHTINPRLFPEQIIYITHHAKDKVLFTDLTFVPLIEKLRDKLPKDMRTVVMTDRAHMPVTGDHLCYEDMLAGQPADYDWPTFDERTASGLCYTSGTTGEPKGALYTHRSSFLHSFGVLVPNRSSFGPGIKVLPVVPLFHVNAWGLPYSSPMSGTTLVFPGAKLDGASLFDLMDGEGVDASWGVPTVWQGLLAEMVKRGRGPKGLKMIFIGGSAAPLPLIQAFERDFGVEMMHGWGMTEMSPVGTCSQMSPAEKRLPPEEQWKLKQSQGRRLYGVDLKILDENGNRLPHDGKASGELHVRGNTVISGYFENEKASREAFDKEGWFRTGDIATISPSGRLMIVDRSKDLIKSGGEWISSIDVENAAMACPGVATCAVIGIAHPKWDERPLLVVVAKEGQTADKQAILDVLATKIAKWQVPDDVVFVQALPLTATGKVSKKDLRDQLKAFSWPAA
ncbi:MAG: long-chain-fatty-acid--CoA ligase [Hyphomicrobiaceae bacterium]